MNRPVEVGSIAPLYRDVKRLLVQSIAAGEWPPGVALPSEARLAERYQVSIGTLRKAIDELVAERVVVRQQGRGTFVATHGSSRLLFHFFHIVPRGGEKQYPRTRTLAFRRSRAEAAEAAKLGIAPGEAVLRIRNLLLLQDAPVIRDELVLPLPLRGPGAEVRVDVVYRSPTFRHRFRWPARLVLAGSHDGRIPAAAPTRSGLGFGALAGLLLD